MVDSTDIDSFYSYSMDFFSTDALYSTDSPDIESCPSATIFFSPAASRVRATSI